MVKKFPFRNQKYEVFCVYASLFKHRFKLGMLAVQ